MNTYKVGLYNCGVGNHNGCMGIKAFLFEGAAYIFEDVEKLHDYLERRGVHTLLIFDSYEKSLCKSSVLYNHRFDLYKEVPKIYKEGFVNTYYVPSDAFIYTYALSDELISCNSAKSLCTAHYYFIPKALRVLKSQCNDLSHAGYTVGVTEYLQYLLDDILTLHKRAGDTVDCVVLSLDHAIGELMQRGVFSVDDACNIASNCAENELLSSSGRLLFCTNYIWEQGESGVKHG